jgi:uncharacterized protein (AIM24 family)
MGGTIQVRSEVGKGHGLHRAAALSGGRRRAPQPAAAGGGPRRGPPRPDEVLLCEDNALNREIAVALLRIAA